MAAQESIDRSPQGQTLHAGALRLAVRADLGGSIAGLWRGDVPVLRSVEPGLLQGPRQSACFPLVPYSNRLGHRRFAWQGRAYTTQANFPDSPHSLHGLGWLRPWHVAAQSADALTLRLQHQPDGDWPFAFEAEQRIALSPHAVHCALRITNTDGVEQPAGLGWHPYFPKRGTSRLRIDVDTRWAADAVQLPTHAVAQPGLQGMVATMAHDHCFGGWAGAACIDDDHHALRLSASVPWLVVFTPPALPHFCVEPVSHVNDAVHAPDPAERGLVALAPGATLDAWMRLEIAPHA